MKGALWDISNSAGATSEQKPQKVWKTFGRKVGAAKAAPHNAESSGAEDAPDVIRVSADKHDKYCLPLPSPKGKPKARARRPKNVGYSRKVAPPAELQEQARREAYLADMRAHFAEVDKYELQVESPAAGSHTMSPTQSTQPTPKPVADTLAVQPAPDPTPSTKLREVAAWVPELPVSFSFGQPPATQPKSTMDATPTSCREPAELLADDEEADLAGTTQAAASAVAHLMAPPAMIPPGSEDDKQEGEHNQPTSDGTQSELSSGTSQSSFHSIISAPPSTCKTPAYGLSRRSSTCFAPQTNALTENAARIQSCKSRFSTAPSLSLTNRLRQSSIASAADTQTSLLRRLSTGLSGTLHRLGILGDVPASQRKEALVQANKYQGVCDISDEAAKMEASGLSGPPSAAAQRRTSVLVGADFSPIAESPEAASNGEPTTVLARSQQTPAGQRTTTAHGSGPPTSELAIASISAALQNRLQLDGSPAPAGSAIKVQTLAEETAELTTLQQLLQVCNQGTDEESIPSMEDLIGQHVDLAQVRKIGEGTFGEAFKGGNMVFKIVPLEGSTLVNGELQKRAEDILAEVAITLTLSQLRDPQGQEVGNVASGFVESHGVGICRGYYAPALLAEWLAWDQQHTSENDPVDCFPGNQLYVVFMIADGGIDLERFNPRSFAEAKSILLQCAMTLAVAEEACEFEHRDLHWGNILLKRKMPQIAHFRLRGVDIVVETAGLLVTLIDFTLSRLCTLTGNVAFCDLSADPELFKGPKGDCQAETYRRMRRATKGNWQKYTPATNTLWMHYLADLLLHQKELPCTEHHKRELRKFRKQAMSYKSCADLVLDDFFAGMWCSGRKP